MTLIDMFVFHTNKDNALSLETFGFYGIDPEASLEEFFRLNVLSETNLLEREMNALKGGYLVCTCSCYYANSGGSSSGDNSAANYNIGPYGGSSTSGNNEYPYIGGRL